MISFEVFREVKRLLALETLSQREIAGITGISRATVSEIKSGRCKGQGYDPRFREIINPTRCPECGARITVVPCVECTIERNRPRLRTSCDPV